jgi:hypothetical protein
MLEEKGAKKMRGRNPGKIRQKPRIFSVLLSISARRYTVAAARTPHSFFQVNIFNSSLLAAAAAFRFK